MWSNGSRSPCSFTHNWIFHFSLCFSSRIYKRSGSVDAVAFTFLTLLLLSLSCSDTEQSTPRGCYYKNLRIIRVECFLFRDQIVNWYCLVSLIFMFSQIKSHILIVIFIRLCFNTWLSSRCLFSNRGGWGGSNQL